MSHITLQQFDGPFDLLLSLINEQKLDISELALSEVTEQYLAYIDELEKEQRMHEIADFLVVASRLLLLKAKRLLPQFLPEEDADEQHLEDQLRRYKRFVEASKAFNALWEEGGRTLFREEPPRPPQTFVWPQNVTVEWMHRSMVQLVHRLAPPKALPEARIDRAVSMKEKIDHIRAILSKKKRTHFFELISERRNKTELIVSFLAMLELVKQKQVALRQNDPFADIMIERI